MKKREMELTETPGETLQAELRARGLTQTALADKIKRQHGHISEVVTGKRKIGVPLALDLERVLGLSADYWLGLQADYDLEQALRQVRLWRAREGS